MELVEGPTLAERIAGTQPLTRPSSGGPPSPLGRGAGGEGVRRSPLAIDETLVIAKQIADALEAAHEKGIIHRDLKPANVKITPEGTVKVLDFGLAKALAPEVSGANLANSPTISIAATQAGVILGTAAYMSPEQAKGKTVDRRTDIWVFGCVLYEMLTSRMNQAEMRSMCSNTPAREASGRSPIKAAPGQSGRATAASCSIDLATS